MTRRNRSIVGRGSDVNHVARYLGMSIIFYLITLLASYYLVDTGPRDSVPSWLVAYKVSGRVPLFLFC